MLKVSVTNVTKLSEDSLFLALDQMTPKDGMYTVVEAELERRAQIHQDMLVKKQKSQIESLQLSQQIQTEISALFAGVKAHKTVLLIEHFGQEFLDDYTLDEETFTIYSKVSHEIFSNPSSWELDSIEKARSKMAKLIYNRIYNKFMRDATIENLELLQRVLGGACEVSSTVVVLDKRRARG